MSNDAKENRRKLKNAVMGRTPVNVYDLSEYGGHEVILTADICTVEELKEMARKSHEGEKSRVIFWGVNCPSLSSGFDENEPDDFTPAERVEICEKVREALEAKGEAVPEWVTETLNNGGRV